MYTVNCLSRFCFNDPCDLISRDLTGLHQQCSELVIVSNRSTNHYSWAEFAHWVYALWTLTPVSPYHYSWAEFARWVYTLWTLTPMQTTDLFWTLKKGYWLLKEIYVNFSSFFLGVGLVVGVYWTDKILRWNEQYVPGLNCMYFSQSISIDNLRIFSKQCSRSYEQKNAKIWQFLFKIGTSKLLHNS